MKKAVMYGGGKIGRGFIGRIFANADYEVVFLDILPELIDELNRRGSYTVRAVTNEETTNLTVAPVRAVLSTTEQAIEEIAACDIMATAVGANNLPEIAPVIARGMIARMEGSGRPLDILLCENQLDASALMRGWIYEHLTDAQRAWADQNLGLIETSIGPSVPEPSPELKAEDPLLLRMEPYDTLPVDSAAFRGEIPPIPGLIPHSPFAFYPKRKLFIHNCGHAICAYLGNLKGCETIWQAMADPEIYAAVEAAMRASARALTGKFGEELRENVENHVSELLLRFQNRALNDTITRVGADPLRKLRRNDRIVGAALFCLEQGVDPTPLLRGIAAALQFERASDASSQELRRALREQGLDFVIQTHMGIRPGEPLFGMIQAACAGGTIRPAASRDLDAILAVVDRARAAIRALGIDQWQDGYPEPEVIQADIAAGIGYVFETNGRIAGYFALAHAPESVYDRIDGAWLTPGSYLTIHRMCIDDGFRGSGLSGKMLAFADDTARAQGLTSVRADTHRGNIVMQRLLERHGFIRCGTVVYEVTAGDPIRIAYEKRIEFQL